MSQQVQRAHVERVTLEQTCMAAASCRQELTRLAQLVERSSSSSSTNSADDSSSSSPHGFMDTLAHFVSSKDSKDKSSRDLEKEHLHLARSCQQAARVSEYEAVALRDSLKLVQALKIAAERERDELEDKLEKHREIIASLQQSSFSAAAASAAASPSDVVQQNQNKTTPTVSKQTTLDSFRQSSSTASTLHLLVDANVGTSTDFVDDDDENNNQQQKSPASPSPLDSECQECVLLRTKLAEETSRFDHRLDALQEELAAKAKQLDSLAAACADKMRRAVAAERTRGEALVRRSAASFLQRSCTAEAVAARKLADAELASLSYRAQLTQALDDIQTTRAESDRASSAASAKISTLEADNRELRRVLHKIASSGSASSTSTSWTSKDDAAVGAEDAQGAFHAWLHARSTDSQRGQTPRGGSRRDSKSSSGHATPSSASAAASPAAGDDGGDGGGGGGAIILSESSSPASTTKIPTISVSHAFQHYEVNSGSHGSPTSSSGIMEAARRLLSAKLATSGHVSVEDETVARALHHTNEQMRDMIEENMKLHLRIRELEGEGQPKK